MDIKYIVMSSGAYNGVNLLGAIYEAEDKNIIKFDNIKAVHGVSAGSIILLIWILRFDKDDLYDYIIDKPWNKSFQYNNFFTDIIQNKGVLTKTFILDMFEPFFKTDSLDLKMTMLELYNITKIVFNVTVTKLNDLSCLNFSHESHPDLPVLDAIYMSCSIPLITQPLYYDNSYIIDGVFSQGYPVKQCLTLNEGALEDEILGFRISRIYKLSAEKECDTLSYVNCIISNIINKLFNMDNVDIENLIHIDPGHNDIKLMLNDSNIRREMLTNGVKSTKIFLDNCGKKFV